MRIPDRYIGKTIELVYVDRFGNVTQRRVIVKQLHERMADVYCLKRMQYRRLVLNQILAFTLAAGKKFG
ncbi:hypothetical protein [Paenibacillus koleovorans]|uniref:hypothetical protein n=1 Tax=Paenibacillus koleovorans TaxID=121608 RepID=UPI000FD95C37|nr:hypothetical protein [Paenibacillus koleovorans]